MSVLSAFWSTGWPVKNVMSSWRRCDVKALVGLHEQVRLVGAARVHPDAHLGRDERPARKRNRGPVLGAARRVDALEVEKGRPEPVRGRNVLRRVDVAHALQERDAVKVEVERHLREGHPDERRRPGPHEGRRPKQKAFRERDAKQECACHVCHCDVVFVLKSLK